jgi:hypothetical protein
MLEFQILWYALIMSVVLLGPLLLWLVPLYFGVPAKEPFSELCLVPRPIETHLVHDAAQTIA